MEQVMERPQVATETQIMHAADGEHMDTLVRKGWQHIKTTFSHGNARLTGGWWLYQGDHAVALEQLEVRKNEILTRSEHFYANHWS